MKLRSIGLLIFMGVLFISSCRKDDLGPLAPLPSGLKYNVQGNNVHITWAPPNAQFDNFTIELSKLPDFSITDDSRTIEEPEHVYRNLNPGGIYYARVRSNRTSPSSQSEWSTLKFTMLPGNILMPVTESDIVGTSVVLKWDFDSTDAGNSSTRVTRVLLTPVIGQATEITLTQKHIDEKTLKVENLKKDMQYTARIYNGNFPSGIQVFTTLAESVGGVWTLSPHSDIQSAIRDSKDGDIINLKAGTYNAWQKLMTIESKAITIKAQAGTMIKPRLYVKEFVFTGAGSSLSLIGIDISGSRLDEFKEEIPNTPDTRWNNWLARLQAPATDFNFLMIKDCIVRNYWTGVLQMNGQGQKANSIIIDNSIVYDIGGDNATETISVHTAGISQALFTNSTYYRTNKMFMVLDRGNGKQNEVVFVFKNNTVDQSWSLGAFSFKELKLPAKVLLQNNLFTNINSAQNFFSNFAYVANNFEKRLINCNFYNVLSKQTIYGSNLANMPVHSWELRHPNSIWTEVKPAFIRNSDQDPQPNSIKEYPAAHNPGYRNAAIGDFTISPGSPLRALDNGHPIGDPRWW